MSLNEKIDDYDMCNEISEVGFHYGSEVLDAPKIIKVAKKLEYSDKNAWEIITKNCDYLNAQKLSEGFERYRDEVYRIAGKLKDDEKITDICETIKYVENSIKKLKKMY